MKNDQLSTKVCRTCGETKQISLFPFDGRSYKKDCRPCFNAYAYRIRAQMSDEKKEKAKAAQRKLAYEWAERNPEKRKKSARDYADRNKEKISEYSKEWSRKNRDKRRTYLSDYRAKQFNASVEWDVELSDLVLREAHHLARAREEHTGIKWHVDHIIPLKSKIVCGLHVWTNWQVIPATVNQSKQNKVVPDGAERSWL